MYAVKSEVAVTAQPPHFCLFVLPHIVGSENEFKNHMEHYRIYLPYLLKTPEEKQQLQGDLQHQYWSVMADKGFIGPDLSTPDENRIIPKKGTVTGHDVQRNEEINRLRVPVEHFFGRIYRLFGIQRKVYCWDHAHFDMDFENMCLLANEDIMQNNLSQVDYEFHVKLLSKKAAEYNENLQKRKGQLQRAADKRKLKRLNVQSAVALV